LALFFKFAEKSIENEQTWKINLNSRPYVCGFDVKGTDHADTLSFWKW
jgi:hypothetical protein